MDKLVEVVAELNGALTEMQSEQAGENNHIRLEIFDDGSCRFAYLDSSENAIFTKRFSEIGQLERLLETIVPSYFSNPAVDFLKLQGVE